MPPTDLGTPAPSQTPRQAAGKAKDFEVVGYDRYVDDQLRRTRRMVKAIDIAHIAMVLAAGWVALLVVAAVFEHWVIRGGFTESGRYAVFGAAAAASIGLVTVRLLPILTRRVNPLYAANAIEQTTPSLKNTLVNLLLLRGNAHAPAALSQELEREAAERIALADGDAAVDRGGLIRLGYLLIGLLVLLVGYAAVSPKNPFATAARLLAPWADIAAPTRVRILDIEPGNAEVAQGDFVTLKTRVLDLAPDEQAWLVSSTADRQQRERRIALQSTGAAGQFELRLPANGSIGLQQDLAYRIEAGDARSRLYRLRVITSPTIVVRNVHYDYPEYTGYLDRDAPNAGDLRAIEGTKVRIDAMANLPIDTAQLDLNADGRPDRQMTFEGLMASAEFTLGLRDDRRTPKHNAYALRLTTIDGRANDNPATHRIEVVPDLPPEVEVVEPKEATRDVRLNETVVLRVRARDPDFGLASVEIKGRRVGAGGGWAPDRELFTKELLRTPQEEAFEGVFRFRPSEHGLKVGDEIEYTAVTTDIKQPGPQSVASRPQRLRVVGEADEAQRQQPDKQNQDNGAKGDGEQQDSGEGEQGSQADGSQSDNADQQNPSGGQNGEEGAGQSPPQSSQDTPPGEQQDASDSREQNQDGKTGSDGAGGIQGDQTQGNGDAEPSDSSSGGAAQPRQGESSDSAAGGAGGGGNQRDSAQSPAGDRSQSPNGDGDDPGADQQQSPVASDGENDAEAFDRLQEVLDRQRERNGGRADGQRPEGGDPQPNESGERGEASDAESGNDASSNAKGRPDGNASDRQPEDSGQDGEGRSPSSENKSRNQSDALGAEEPQNQGGGEKGRGEESPRDGSGSPGEANSADDGQGQAADRGAGDATNAAGERQTSDERTGNSSGDQTGNGSKQRDASQGEAGGGDADASQQPSDGKQGDSSEASDGGSERGGDPAAGASSDGGDPGDASDAQAGQPGSQEDGSRDASSQQPAGDATADGSQRSGKSGDGVTDRGEPTADRSPDRDPRVKDPSAEQRNKKPQGDPSGKSNTPGGSRDAKSDNGRKWNTPAGDDANLDYAKKRTDLILDELSDRLREKNVDRELLDELGWSEEELRQFVQRWRGLKQRAKSSAKGRAELDDSLRSLGLKQRELATQVDRTADDTRVGAGYRGNTPAAVRERMRAYNAGVSRGASNERTP